MAETKKTETKTVKSSETKAAAKPAAKKTTTATKAATTKKAPATKKVTEVKVEAKVETVVEVKAEVANETKAPVAKASNKKPATQMLKVTLVKSGAGRLIKQKRTLEALGLRKTNSSNIVPDNAATRGMLFVVKHLVSVEKV